MEFLNIVAADIIRRLGKQPGTQLKDLTIVFPNKRASLFMNQYLAQHVAPPFWAPHYMTISEVFESMSSLTLADPVLLTFFLYKAYIAETHSAESFDHFYSWGEVLLNDFDDLDSAMVDADKLFANITDLEQLKRFDYIDEEQEAAIRRLFNSFNVQSVTQLQERYLQMWRLMPRIYKRFRQMLHDGGYAYTGMLQREVVESFKSQSGQLMGGKRFALVGFNVLNETERRLFLKLKEEAETLFYWDYDSGYTDGRDAEAGMFISDNIKLFGNSLSEKPELFNNLRGTKQIHFVAASTDSAQAAYAGAWLKQRLDGSMPLNRTAVVLCDESMLASVMECIPPTYGDGMPTQVNITMGYPLQETPVVSFIISILELMYRGWSPSARGGEGRWRFSYAQHVLRHPYTWLLNKDDAVGILSRCNASNQSYPPCSWFAGKPFIADIFSPSDGNICADLMRLNQVVQAVAIRSSQTLYTESLYTASTVISRFIRLMEEEHLDFDSPDTLLRLMRQALASRSVAFHGEPAVGIQIMGILETRNLDFENLIILSCNEGMLPRQAHVTSFILNFLREAYGMTTTRRRVALYAYYFYRLISRGRHISIVYNNDTDSSCRGEMSRFMMQLKYDPTITISSETTLRPLPSVIVPAAASLGLNASKGFKMPASLSPSALNTYIDCPLRFYLQYICSFSDDDEVCEDVADNLFGSIFHNALERFYAPRRGRRLTLSDYPTGKDEAYLIHRLVDEAFAKEMLGCTDEAIAANNYTLHLTGTQMLNHDVICRYVKKQLESDRQVLPLTIIATEQKLYQDFRFTDQGGNECCVKIGGIIDREDIATIKGHEVHRIVDYKTSVRAKTTKSIADLFDPACTSRSSHIFQTLYYCEVMHLSRPDGPPISPTLLYVKQPTPPEKSTVCIGSEPVTDYMAQCHEEFQTHLQALLRNIADPSTPFTSTAVESHCTYCPFVTLCKK
ncbi:MAG: PD-(D/E)XK nuclease family protein [Bacteroidaceae bacterium]|nr:PD-(D/E)XK nuclease family protein [Bacteroidaceae bacterium]